ncbi:hypothetical protein CYMTET_23847 [Cymbomonas tetramitiformis]|uniref:Uncharacterized protein n=1 Tax=Cymbomonas tetramitiformis TaxID=36881 RepID=A0AAE0FXP1_9CHLO|nr:hypothetical protein CYMTET_23847 [Cymbomonas tetramitiformis]
MEESMKSLLLQAEKFKNEAVARSTEAVTQLSGILKKDSSADSLSALEQKSPMGSSLSLSDVESGKKVPVSVLRHRINELAKKTKKEGRDFRFRMGVVGVVVLAFLFIVGLVSLFSGGGSPEVAKEETAALSGKAEEYIPLNTENFEIFSYRLRCTKSFALSICRLSMCL